MKIYPAYHPRNDDGSDRYMVVQYNIMDTAVHADKVHAHAEQCATSFGSAQHSHLILKRNISRASPGQTMFAGRGSSTKIHIMFLSG
eukprot:6111204-Pyramimonas_sp.AAC.1